MLETRKTRNTIVKLLSNMGSQKEVQQYLGRFSQLDESRFAVVKVGGAVLADELDELASALGFLQRVGLTPIVIHGAGPQLNKEFSAQNIATHIIDGMRETRADTLKVVRQTVRDVNIQLVEKMQANETRATSIINGVFNCRLMDEERYGYVGRVETIDLSSIKAALRASSIPVIACSGETDSGQIVNVNADIAAQELVKAVTPYKIVFLTGTGGLLDEKGKVIPSVNLSTDYDGLMKADWVHSGMELKLRQICELLQDLPLSSSVSITTAGHLTRELFTHKGAGTLVRRGEKMLSFDSWEGVDKDRLKELIELSFGRELSSNYFESIKIKQIFVTEHYRAAAIITDDKGLSHMDKFVVHPEARGEGLARVVWQEIRNEHAQLFWRARQNNPINQFYYMESDGCIKKHPWTIFWYGLTDMAAIQSCVETASQRPASI
ncbi:MAG: acetylglutamate kinase [bacterium]